MEKTLQERVGNRIKEIRIQKEISQQDLAAKCNFEKSNMSRIEAGKTNMTLSTIEIIVKALDVRLADLFEF